MWYNGCGVGGSRLPCPAEAHRLPAKDYMAKPTSHITKSNHPKRRPIPGLTPDDLIKKMQEAASVPRKGKALRKVRDTVGGQDGKVLPDAREGGSNPDGRVGIFGTAPGSGDQVATVSDAARTSESTGSQLTRVLKRILGEQPPAALLEHANMRAATNAEMLAAIIMREALGGRQWAVEMVRDQTEGKPVRAAQLNNNDAEIEDQLDRVSTAALNRLAKD